jgi:dihydrofolate reductase
MRTLASFIIISLDGFYEGPNGELDWPTVDEEFEEFAVRQLDEADTLGFGRATYEHMAAYWPTEQAEANDPAITSRMNDMEKLVFSTTLTDASWSGTTVVRGEATEQMPTIKSVAGRELLVLGSAHLTADLAQAGLLDELRIMVCPIVLGQGRSLFEDLKDRVSLTLLRVRQFDSGNVVLTYRPSPQVGRPTRLGQRTLRSEHPAARPRSWPHDNRSGSGDDGQPGLRSVGIDGDVDDGRVDRDHSPSLGEVRTDLILGHPPRTPIAGLVVAEAQHEVVAPHRDRRSQAAHKSDPLLVVEHVEQAAVEHGIELLAEARKVQCVPHLKAGGNAAFGRLGLG